MAKAHRPSKQQHDLLEVHGFDLLADIEAMLRHARQYQREVQRLRGILGKGQTDTSDQPPLEAVREHLTRLCKAVTDLSSTLNEVCGVAGMLNPTPDRGSKSRAPGGRESRGRGQRDVS